MPFLPFEPAPAIGRLLSTIGNRRFQRERRKALRDELRADRRGEEREFWLRVRNCDTCGPGATLCSKHYTELCARGGVSV